MKKIIFEKKDNGYYELFGQRFYEIARGNLETPEIEFSKLKEGDRIEIKKIRRG